MTWIILAMLNEEYSIPVQEPSTGETTRPDVVHSPILIELIEGLGQDVEANVKREDFANSLREVVKNNASKNGTL